MGLDALIRDVKRAEAQEAEIYRHAAMPLETLKALAIGLTEARHAGQAGDEDLRRLFYVEQALLRRHGLRMITTVRFQKS